MKDRDVKTTIDDATNRVTPPLDTDPRPTEVTIGTDRLRDLEQVAEAARCYEYGGRWSMAEARQKRDEARAEGLSEPRYFQANDPAVEALAALEHKQWEEWSRTIAEQGLTPERIERWQAYWVPYADLADDVQEHDRVWARRAIAALRDAGYTVSRPSDEPEPFDAWRGTADEMRHDR